MHRFTVSFALLLGLSLAASAAHAEPSSDGGTRLSFVRTADATDCIAAPALEREIARRMRRDPFKGPARQWVDAVIERVDGVYAVQLFERDLDGKTLGSGTLRSETGDCHELDAAMVLAIALIIDPTVQLAPASEAPELSPSGAEKPPQSLPELAIPPDSAAAARSAKPPISQCVPEVKTQQPAGEHPRAAATYASVDGVLVHGVLPGFAPGVELASQLPLGRTGDYALRLSALYLPETRSQSALGDFSYGLSALEVGACRVARDARWRLFGCAAFGVGAVHAVVQDLAPLRPGDRLWLSLRAEAGVAVHLVGPVWVDARLFDLIALQRWEFRVRTENGGQKAFEQSILMPGAALGIGLEL